MTRNHFIKMISMLPLLRPVDSVKALLDLEREIVPAPGRLPVLFFGHGDYRNAFRDNPFTRQIHSIGKELPFKPSAVLVISGHYLSAEESYLKVQPHFDSPYYPVKGAVDFGNSITADLGIRVDDGIDLDHGAWIILNHLFPEKDVPVMELSMPMNLPINYHWEMAQKLKPFRDKGVLIVGSGNVVHNLELSMLKKFLFIRKPFSWALEMDEWIKNNIDNRNYYNLFNYPSKGRAATLAINTADHYIPMLYILGMVDAKENIIHTYEEVFAGISMRCFKTV
jgi:4,5-DOPA dioxygenase extradiol